MPGPGPAGAQFGGAGNDVQDGGAGINTNDGGSGFNVCTRPVPAPRAPAADSPDWTVPAFPVEPDGVRLTSSTGW
ncbi:hypothetical protein [Streptomyces sp. NPDC059552]|uniref:hypothetical protein n=1 Tax=Streptomyces sp. NPDC059552 TaxID=3346862 RepID=UPI0036854FF3